MRASVMIAAAAVGLWIPAALAAQSPEERIAAAHERALAAGVPASLLDSKVAEGRAKGIPMDRIAEAVERRQEALARAQEALRGQSQVGEADLALGADALRSGVGEEVLRALAESAPPERRAVAIAALTQLVELGHVPLAALERVQEALSRGPEALMNLPAQAAAGRGGPPAVPGPQAGPRGGPPPGVPAAGEPPRSGRPGGPGRGGGPPPGGGA